MLIEFFKTHKLILVILFIGLIYRFYLTADGNFIFNMDNARDLVDVREIVVLQKLRLIGPTSAIEGFFTGPAWYYLLAIPFVLTNGDPYGAIIMQFVLWAIGGFFLLKLSSRYGIIAVLVAGLSWIASNVIILATSYSFNPNPVTLLTPLFVYLLERYLVTKRLIYSVGVWFLGGLFFNFEMNFGFFTPFIILAAILVTGNSKLIKDKSFWVGILFFIFCLLPQALFELKHNFFMTKSVLNYLRNPSATEQTREIFDRLPLMRRTFYDILVPGFMNNIVFTKALLMVFLIFILKHFLDNRVKKDLLILICLTFVLVPFLGYVFLPVNVNSWHLGGIVAVAILFSGILMSWLVTKKMGSVIVVALLFLFLTHSMVNISNYLKDSRAPSNDPMLYRNENASIDYIYQKAAQKNFKVFTYLPSIIDYPQQYLYWWRGLTKYGYVPKEYAYLPNMPEYINNKNSLPTGENPPYEGLVFLVKQSDTRGERHLWENSFKHMELLSSEQFGPYVIEIRKETVRF